MKSIVSLLILFALLISCGRSGKPKKDINVSSRDSSITKSNSYSDLFLDSSKMETFFETEKIPDTLRQRIKNFYNTRNYQFAWFTQGGPTLQAAGFWEVHNNYLLAYGDSSIDDRQLHTAIDTMLVDSSNVSLQKDSLETLELAMTRHFFSYANAAYGSSMDPEQMQWYIPRRKLDMGVMLDSFISTSASGWKPLNRQFYRMQDVLLKYRAIEKKGSWTPIIMQEKKLKQGDSAVGVTYLKKHLALLGTYDANDTSALFTDTLGRSVKRMQTSFGLIANGVLDAALLKELNVPISDRIRQMIINLERMKWMPKEPPFYLLANIPEFRLHVVKNEAEVFGMNVVVGRAANSTVIFSDELKFVVFSPYWNVPSSIVKSETYPAMKRTSSYLQKHNMEVTGYSGGLPIVRQKPGGSNALGQVKFLFPNSYNIYFHDTPSKGLFNNESRAFSHGCIRLGEPYKLAAYLLADRPEWTEESIRAAMSAPQEKWITLEKPVPVFITYFTSWVDAGGLLHFTKDIYGHDKKMATQLFAK